MTNSKLRPAAREDVLFAISLGLNTRHGHAMAARVAAEVVLASLERQGFVLMRKPDLPMPGVAAERSTPPV